ncbi:MAG: DUF1501 domain-containing protein [Stagnimonas sp.]|nr:DUF1501 domain-containing protein [Stagnimonas sp.]
MTALPLNRRQLLGALGASGLLLAWHGLGLAASDSPRRLMVVLLRGGMDGLAAVPAYAEPGFAALRGALDTGAPGGEQTSLKLDGSFGLHPALRHCAAAYQAGELAVVHAVAPPYHGRSHFEAQDCLENGSDRPHASQDGWLNRSLSALPGSEGLAIASALPLMLRGPAPAETWSPSPLPEASGDLAQRVSRLYERDARLGPAFRRAADSQGLAMGRSEGRPRNRLPESIRQAASLMRGRDGLRLVMVEDGGWDTHARQGGAQGALAGKLGKLDEALATAKTALGPLWPQTVIVVATEFGRTVRVNGSGGTDHGTGGVMLLSGGAVRGGKVHADWPGLGPSALLDGRDLRPTTDSRAVFKGLLLAHLGLAESVLAERVFPNSRDIRPLEGLVHS